MAPTSALGLAVGEDTAKGLDTWHFAGAGVEVDVWLRVCSRGELAPAGLAGRLANSYHNECESG